MLRDYTYEGKVQDVQTAVPHFVSTTTRVKPYTWDAVCTFPSNEFVVHNKNKKHAAHRIKVYTYLLRFVRINTQMQYKKYTPVRVLVVLILF